MNECITIEDIYEKSNLSDIDIHIENMISLKLLNKDYTSALNIINYTITNLLTTVIEITNTQINECKENTQDNIITITRFIDTSRNMYNEMKKKLEDFGSRISFVENIKSGYMNYVCNPNINYNYNISLYTMLHEDIYYNIRPFKFISSKEYKNNDDLVITQKYCIYLINRLYSSDIKNYIDELIQLGCCILITALNNKKTIYTANR